MPTSSKNRIHPGDQDVYDYVIIGSGFGGSVCAMRLVEKGYSVLVLERGRRYAEGDFPRTNWDLRRYLWLPGLRCYGIMQFSLFRNLLAVHGDGVGGGSLVYGNVLMRPDDRLFDHPAWRQLQDWKSLLLPHYATAERMLGVTDNPHLWQADEVLHAIAAGNGSQETFRPTRVGVLFGSDPKDDQGRQVPDPYFNGNGPDRQTCIHCGGCLVGCRHNAKNSLVKNYLFFAEKWGAQVLAEAWVDDVIPLPPHQPDQARYQVTYHHTGNWFPRRASIVRARNVIFSAGTLGTLSLLFRCRDVTGSLPLLSHHLGQTVRSNSEALLGVMAPDRKVDYSRGITISSIFNADPSTAIEPVRYSSGSSFIRIFSLPMIAPGGSLLKRLLTVLWKLISHPMEFMRSYILPGWAQTTTILMAMQTEDNGVRMRLGRSWLTLFRRGLVTQVVPDHPVPARIELGHRVAQEFTRRIGGTAAGSIFELLFDIPVTAHILGGVSFGRHDQEGVIGLDCQVHNYPGLYVVDGSIMPANPGVNPSLTITALAEYAMSQVPPRSADAPISVGLELFPPHHQQVAGAADQPGK